MKMVPAMKILNAVWKFLLLLLVIHGLASDRQRHRGVQSVCRWSGLDGHCSNYSEVIILLLMTTFKQCQKKQCMPQWNTFDLIKKGSRVLHKKTRPFLWLLPIKHPPLKSCKINTSITVKRLTNPSATQGTNELLVILLHYYVYMLYLVDGSKTTTVCGSMLFWTKKK